jgi:hypothetical protein
MTRSAVEIEKILARTKPNTIDRELAKFMREEAMALRAALSRIAHLERGQG